MRKSVFDMAKKSTKSTSPFTIHNLVSAGAGKGSFLIIAHRDLDGLISAYLLATALKDNYKKINIVFSQPYMACALRQYLTHKNCLNTYKGVAIVDLAVDYSKPRTTKNLISWLGDHVKYIFDHHAGWEKLISVIDAEKLFTIRIEGIITSAADPTRNIVLGKALCCAQLIYDYFKLSELRSAYIDDLLTIAMISDDLNIRRDYENTEAYTIFTNFKNNTIEGCLEQMKSSSSVEDITCSGNWYERSLKKAGALIQKAEEIYPGIGYLKTSADDPALNYTVIYEQAYKKYKILIIKELDARKLRISYTIAHTLPNLDLVEVFGLKSGNPKRICVYSKGWNIYNIVDKLKPFVDDAYIVQR